LATPLHFFHTQSATRRTAMRRIVESSKVIGKSVLVTLAFLMGAAMAQEPPAVTSETEVKPVRQIIVSIPDRKLALVFEGRTVKVYSIAVGAAQSPSPEGEFKVINRIENPTYYKPGTVIEPGPENPLGTRWIGLNRKGYGIHGTNVPSSIGKAASHGCIRMRQQDLEELFTVLREGDVVRIRANRDEELAKLLTPEPTITTTEEAPEVEAAADFDGRK
jgi:hypothetical protein